MISFFAGFFIGSALVTWAANADVRRYRCPDCHGPLSPPKEEPSERSE